MRRGPSGSFHRWWWLLIATAWGVVGVTGYGVWMIVHDGRLAEESARWPSTPGTVVSSSLSAGGGHRSPRTYGVAITYRYTVDGRTFEGRRAAFNPSFSKRDSQAIVDSHPAGSPVLVYYRPQDPETCVLQPGGGVATAAAALLSGAGLAVGLLAGFMTWFAWRMPRLPRTRAEGIRQDGTRARHRTRAR